MNRFAYRLESGRINLHIEETSLTSLIEDVRTGASAKAKGVSFEIHTGGIPEKVITDASRLRQIVTNVTNNAIKFTPPGGLVTLDVNMALTDTGRSIEFKVTDTGIGIAPEHHAKIFEPFTQAELETSRKYGGTGLGLTLSRNLARALGGDLVLAASAPAHGSTFVIRVDDQYSRNHRVSSVASAPVEGVQRQKGRSDRKSSDT